VSQCASCVKSNYQDTYIKPAVTHTPHKA